MSASLRTLLVEAARRHVEAPLVMLCTAAPAFDVRSFLAGATEGRLLWSAAAIEGDGSWELAGQGEAVRVESSGADRLRALEARATRTLAEVVVLGDELGPPRPRMFGGIAFGARADEGGASPPWMGFGDASFVMPRWLYARRGDRAFLSMTIAGAELRDEPRLFAEAQQMEDRVERRAAAAARTGQRPPTAPVVLEPMSIDAWERLVSLALERIRGGELEKVVASRRTLLTARAPIDVDEVLERLAGSQPGCAEFAFQRGPSVFVGATPEPLVKKRALVVETEALAGSAPRRDDHDGAAALFASEKDRREQAVVVRGICAALEPLCGAIDVPAEPRVRSLRNVHHLSSPIAGELREPTHVLRVIEALHPTAAVCGTPRDRAMAFITTNEPSRGWYAAPIGWFDGAGDGAFVVALRSALIEHERAWLFSGAGIVEGSDPRLEYAETALKLAPMLAALGAIG